MVMLFFTEAIYGHYTSTSGIALILYSRNPENSPVKQSDSASICPPIIKSFSVFFIGANALVSILIYLL